MIYDLAKPDPEVELTDVFSNRLAFLAERLGQPSGRRGLARPCHLAAL